MLNIIVPIWFFVFLSCKNVVKDDNKLANREINVVGLRNLTEAVLNRAENEVSWSPDGEFLCFSPLDNQDIWLINYSGTQAFRIFSYPPPDTVLVHFAPGTLSWAPDSKRIIFNNSFFHPTSKLLILTLEDTSVVPLIIQDGEKIYPGGDCSWSPDGETIAFIHDLTHLMFVPVTGGTPTTIFSMDSGGFNDTPAWSPDGETIALSGIIEGIVSGYDIYLISLDGEYTILPGSSDYSENNPDWSPDGSMIAFSSKREGNSDIYVYDFETGKTTRLTTHTGIDGDPSWSPDGTEIAFISDRSGPRDIWIMELSYNN